MISYINKLYFSIMIKKRFLSMLVLLCLTVSGAWAQEGTLLTLTATVAEPTYTVSLKEGTDDATSWQGKAGSGEYQSLPLEGEAEAAGLLGLLVGGEDARGLVGVDGQRCGAHHG